MFTIPSTNVPRKELKDAETKEAIAAVGKYLEARQFFSVKFSFTRVPCSRLQ